MESYAGEAGRSNQELSSVGHAASSLEIRATEVLRYDFSGQKYDQWNIYGKTIAMAKSEARAAAITRDIEAVRTIAAEYMNPVSGSFGQEAFLFGSFIGPVIGSGTLMYVATGGNSEAAISGVFGGVMLGVGALVKSSFASDKAMKRNKIARAATGRAEENRLDVVDIPETVPVSFFSEQQVTSEEPPRKSSAKDWIGSVFRAVKERSSGLDGVQARKSAPGQRVDVLEEWSEFAGFGLNFKLGEFVLDVIAKDQAPAELWGETLEPAVGQLKKNTAVIDAANVQKARIQNRAAALKVVSEHDEQKMDAADKEATTVAQKNRVILEAVIERVGHRRLLAETESLYRDAVSRLTGLSPAAQQFSEIMLEVIRCQTFNGDVDPAYALKTANTLIQNTVEVASTFTDENEVEATYGVLKKRLESKEIIDGKNDGLIFPDFDEISTKLEQQKLSGSI